MSGGIQDNVLNVEGAELHVKEDEAPRCYEWDWKEISGWSEGKSTFRC